MTDPRVDFEINVICNIKDSLAHQEVLNLCVPKPEVLSALQLEVLAHLEDRHLYYRSQWRYLRGGEQQQSNRSEIDEDLETMQC